MKKKTKIFSIGAAILLVALVCFCYFRYYYVFGEGVKTGDLNFVVYKGYLFKTYEGQLIQAGFKGNKGTASGVQSYEFNFSIADRQLAEILMHSGGKTVELHYKEYLGALPWRGKEKHVVCSIVSISEE